MSATRAARRETDAEVEARFWRGTPLAFAGAIVFSIPALMTVEVWDLGATMDPRRLIILLVVAVPVLTGMSFFAGFRPTFSLVDDLVDAFVAYAVGFAVALAFLAGFAVLEPGVGLVAAVGQLALAAVGASMGALLARSLLGDERDRHEEEGLERRASYGGKLFYKLVGALVLCFAIAPTEEIGLIAQQMSGWHAVVVAVLTLGLMHGFVHVVERRRSPRTALSNASVFLRHTCVGYALALFVSAYILWTFGRLDGNGVAVDVAATVVLGLPAAVGAGAARAIV